MFKAFPQVKKLSVGFRHALFILFIEKLTISTDKTSHPGRSKLLFQQEREKGVHHSGSKKVKYIGNYDYAIFQILLGRFGY